MTLLASTLYEYTLIHSNMNWDEYIYMEQDLSLTRLDVGTLIVANNILTCNFFWKKINLCSAKQTHADHSFSTSVWRHRWRKLKESKTFTLNYYNFWTVYLFLISSALVCSTGWDEQNLDYTCIWFQEFYSRNNYVCITWKHKSYETKLMHKRY
jgi:hypothetical protein